MKSGHTYYVYALKDPRSNPAKPFYIGKGTGVRAWEHLLTVDKTKKGARIREIREASSEPIVVKLIQNLTESEALLLESELIAAFGTEAHGGLLTNAIIPVTVNTRNGKSELIVPSGTAEKAQIAVSLLKEAVFELALANESGITNSDAVHALGLHSEYMGGSKDYLSWSVLGLLMREGKLKRVDKKKHQAQVR